MYPDKIFLIGFMGVGKSFWGKKLAQALQYTFVDLDEEIISRAGGRTISAIFEQEGEEFFRKLEADCLRAVTEREQPVVVACGGGAPCFLNNIEHMKKAGRVVWLQAEPGELIPRLLAERQQRPLISDLNEEELEAYILKKLGDRRLYYREAHRSVLESSLNEANLIQSILHE